MEFEKQILIEENQTLHKRVESLEKDLSLYKRKNQLCVELIKGIAHLVPNLFVKFEEELEKMDGEDTIQRTDNT